MTKELLKQQACQYIDTHKEKWFRIADELHAHPEVGEKEFFAAQFLTTTMKEFGFTVTAPLEEVPSLPTAFKAEKGDGPIHIAFLAEYDALPELGHACGHNLIAMMSISAATALAEVAGDKATSHLFGCPAEETIGGKVYMSDAGIFDKMDAAMIVHPDEISQISGTSYATHPLEVTFLGEPAHIASRTHFGINALDALIEFYS